MLQGIICWEECTARFLHPVGRHDLGVSSAVYTP